MPARQTFLNADDIKDALLAKKAVDVIPARKPEAKVPQSDIVEIDLHAHELLDSTAGMSNGEILNYQLDVFRKTLEEYKSKKGQKIVFIHGKGDGVLRKAILQELKYKYKNYQSQDASFREYGFGAARNKTGVCACTYVGYGTTSQRWRGVPGRSLVYTG